ncbi:hypothetical protein TNCT_66591 [Trichonephila clavata]|uniref:Secreted protein n=1 Tax=Trichonephila clavata TaxID=2740835 RepID=A0A8X6KWM6_TRICU|nr:hypothetical protein TNCT_66591 [Trichonephila clavata]
MNIWHYAFCCSWISLAILPTQNHEDPDQWVLLQENCGARNVTLLYRIHVVFLQVNALPYVTRNVQSFFRSGWILLLPIGSPCLELFRSMTHS